MASSADPAPAAAVRGGRDLVDVVDDRLPAWRAHRPRRLLAAAWPTAAVRMGERNVDVAVLPLVGTRWFTRGGRYWTRRVGAIVGLLVAAVVQVVLDVDLLRYAADSGAFVPVAVIAVVLAVAGAFLYWRPDLLARTGVPGTHPLPGPVKTVAVVLGGFGLVTTPTWLLSAISDQLRRFPPQERLAWERVVDQLSAPVAPVRRRHR